MPQGWEVIRLGDPEPIDPMPTDDDLDALAHAIRQIGFADDPSSAFDSTHLGHVVELGRKAHLSLIADVENRRPGS